jgi:hypothetical protein
MNTRSSTDTDLLIAGLDEAELFVLYAARMYRCNRQCLCHLFHAAGMCGTQGLFMELQDALCADAQAGFVAGERGAATLNRQEALLLGALSHWQRHPGDLSDHALDLLVSPAGGRVAAPLAREFARRLTRAGLLLQLALPVIGQKHCWHSPATLSLMH